MKALIRAEARKLVGTRTYRALGAGAVVLIAGSVAVTASAATFGGGPSPARATLALAGLAQTFALVAGALAVTGEYRHKTIISAVLTTPRRVPVLAAKLVTLMITGLAFGLLATGIATAIALPLLAGRHIATGIDGPQLAAIIAGGGTTTALCAALGVGIGAIVRNQVGAVIAVLVLLYVVEPLLGFVPGAGPAVQEYGIGGLATAATGTTGYPAITHLLGRSAAVAVLTGYAAIAVLAGAVLLWRRDVTA
jgi:ABC-2 type transport system permease protein